MKITRRKLKQIIREEKARISEMHHGRPHGDLDNLVEDTLEYISGGSFSNGMQIVQYVRDAGRDYGLSASDQDKAIARIINGIMGGPRF